MVVLAAEPAVKFTVTVFDWVGFSGPTLFQWRMPRLASCVLCATTALTNFKHAGP